MVELKIENIHSCIRYWRTMRDISEPNESEENVENYHKATHYIDAFQNVLADHGLDLLPTQEEEPRDEG